MDIPRSTTFDCIQIVIVLLQRLQLIEHTVRQMDMIRRNTLDSILIGIVSGDWVLW
jgi:hypothetical protein